MHFLDKKPLLNDTQSGFPFKNACATTEISTCNYSMVCRADDDETHHEPIHLFSAAGGAYVYGRAQTMLVHGGRGSAIDANARRSANGNGTRQSH